jgi:hypothetical protein
MWSTNWPFQQDCLIEANVIEANEGKMMFVGRTYVDGIFSVLEFNAVAVKPDGTGKDQATADANVQTFQKAIDAASEVNGQVSVPPGTYFLSGSLTIKAGIAIRGMRMGSVLDFTLMTHKQGDPPLFDMSQCTVKTFVPGLAAIHILDNTRGIVVEGLSILGPTNWEKPQDKPDFIGLFVGNGANTLNNCAFRDLEIDGFGCGLMAYNTYEHQFQSILIGDCILAAYLAGVNNTDFLRCHFSNCAAGVLHSNCHGVNFTSCNIEEIHGNDFVSSQGGPSVHRGGVALELFQSAVTLINPYFEAITDAFGPTEDEPPHNKHDGLIADLVDGDSSLISKLLILGGVSENKGLSVRANGLLMPVTLYSHADGTQVFTFTSNAG